MKTIIAFAAALAVLALPTAADAASKNRHQRQGHGAYARSQGQIACTQYGCIPVPARAAVREGGREPTPARPVGLRRGHLPSERCTATAKPDACQRAETSADLRPIRCSLTAA